MVGKEDIFIILHSFINVLDLQGLTVVLADARITKTVTITNYVGAVAEWSKALHLR